MWIVIDSPIGPLRIVARDGSITAVQFSPFPDAAADAAADADADADAGPDGTTPLLAEAARQLGEYFSGTRTRFDLPLAPVGTLWQRAVWDQLLAIEYGTTASYGEIAARLGRTNVASRAVGLANGSNPIPILIPCHRVIGANGTLTGYAGGVDRKLTLLELERPVVDALF